MKKLLLIFSVAGALFLTSCGDNENTVNPQPLGTATVSGVVYGEFDNTNDELETVNNKKIIVHVYDIDFDSEQTILRRTFETSTDGDGNYSIEVEVGSRPVAVELYLTDFRQVIKYSDSESEEIIIEGIYNSTGVEFAVKGGEYIRDIYFNVND